MLTTTQSSRINQKKPHQPGAVGELVWQVRPLERGGSAKRKESHLLCSMEKKKTKCSGVIGVPKSEKQE